MSDEEHSESEFYYPDELEFQENFVEKEETTSISCERADEFSSYVIKPISIIAQVIIEMRAL